jgi:quercetin dioxygenase-like cupin family protein
MGRVAAMARTGWQTLELEHIAPISVAGVSWLPVRRELGVEAFGVNAYVADAGELVVEEHTEQGLRHEEVYVVLRGAATFTLDGEERDAPQGTVVHIPNTHVRRSALATQDGTTVLAVGAPIEEAYRPSAWEWAFAAQQFRPSADHDAALALLADGLERHPESPAILYEVACWQTLAGRHDEALATLVRAVDGDPKCATSAQTDDDLGPLRELPGFPVAPPAQASA